MTCSIAQRFPNTGWCCHLVLVEDSEKRYWEKNSVRFCAAVPAANSSSVHSQLLTRLFIWQAAFPKHGLAAKTARWKCELITEGWWEGNRSSPAESELHSALWGSLVRVVLFLCAFSVTQAMSQVPNLTDLKTFTQCFMLLSFGLGRVAFHTAIEHSAPLPGILLVQPAHLPIRLAPAAWVRQANWCWHWKRLPCYTQNIMQPFTYASSWAVISPWAFTCSSSLQSHLAIWGWFDNSVPHHQCFVAPILALGLEISLEQGSSIPAVLQSARQNTNCNDKVWNTRA